MLEALKGDLGLLRYRQGQEQTAPAADPDRDITRGDDPRITQVRDLIGPYTDDPAFASAFLTGLGADGLQHLATITTQDDRNGVAGLQQDLGRIPARGTQDPGDQWQVTTGWVKDLTTAGRRRWAYPPTPPSDKGTAHGRPALSNGHRVHGYQALGVRLRTGTHSATFLDAVGGDMLAADRAGNGIPATASRPGPTMPGTTPASPDRPRPRHPHAQAFLTAETTGGKGTGPERLPRVDYLVTDRNRGTDDTGINALGTRLRTASTTEPAALRIVESIVHETATDENTSRDTFTNSQILPQPYAPASAASSPTASTASSTPWETTRRMLMTAPSPRLC